MFACLVAVLCVAAIVLMVKTTGPSSEVPPIKEPCPLVAKCLPDLDGGLLGGRSMYLPL